MIPIRDMLPCRTTPVVTRAIVVVNALVFFLWPDRDAAVRALGAVAAHFTGLDPQLPDGVPPYELIPRTGAYWVRALTHMFVHGSLLHLLGNMWFLWIFGDNVEDRLGRARYTVLYLLSGLVALTSQVAAEPASGVPMVGASGAVAGVLGAYLVLFPHTKVITLVPLFFLPLLVALPASLFLWLWLGFQVFAGLGFSGPGIAWWAHIGGFLFGMVAVSVLAPRPKKRIQVEWER